jgi:hypothetical protein
MSMYQPSWVSLAASSGLSFPSDGEGNVSVIRANSTAIGATTFTSTTVTDAGGWTLASAAVGDYVAVTTGEWGIVVAKAAPLLTVDKWRYHVIGQRTQTTRTPATGGAGSVVVYGPNNLAGATEYRIGAITFPLATATETVALTDPFGNALANLTWTLVAGQTLAPTSASVRTAVVMPMYRPFGIKCSNTGEIVLINYCLIK